MRNNGATYDEGGGKKLWLLLLTLVLIGVVAAAFWFLTRQPAEEVARDNNPLTQSEVAAREATLLGVSAGQIVSGKVTLTVSVNDSSRVERVEYYIDGVFAGVSYAQPFSFVLDTANLSAGEHTIAAKIYDKNGRVVDISPVKITVDPINETQESEQVVARTHSQSGRAHSSPSSPASETHSSGGGNNDGGDTPGDSTPPTAPTNLTLSATDGYTSHLTWNASTDNVGVTGYQIFRDGAQLTTVSTLSYQDQTVVPGNTYEYWVKAVDGAGNESSASNEPDITLEPTSIWLDADTPREISADSESYELGTKFRPLVDGVVTGVKFYKGTGNTGTHAGNLWEGDGTHLASVAFTNETATGWQTATFSSPITVTAGTTYVISYSAPNGHYASTSQYFASEGITSQYLTALASGVEGGNGVYAENPGDFPVSSFQNTNYWVDVIFAPNPQAGGPAVKQLDNSKVYPGFPGSNNTGVPVGKRIPTRDREIVAYQPVTMTGMIEVRAPDVIIRTSKINGVVYLDRSALGSDTWSVTIEDSEVAAGDVIVGAVREGNITIIRSNIHGGQHSVHCGGNCTVTDSWLHGQYVFTSPTDSHNNGFLSNGGSNMTLTHNTLSCDAPNIGSAGCSGDLSLFGDFSPITDVTIDNNLFTASLDTPFCLFAGYQDNKPFGLDVDNIDITNNVFQRGTNNLCGAFGPVTNYLLDGVGTPPPNSTWQNNTWDDGAPLLQ